jgi:hypothetical protein
MTKTILKVAKTMSLMNHPAYRTCAVNDSNNIESGKTMSFLNPPAYSK